MSSTAPVETCRTNHQTVSVQDMLAKHQTAQPSAMCEEKQVLSCSAQAESNKSNTLPQLLLAARPNWQFQTISKAMASKGAAEQMVAEGTRE